MLFLQAALLFWPETRPHQAALLLRTARKSHWAMLFFATQAPPPDALLLWPTTRPHQVALLRFTTRFHRAALLQFITRSHQAALFRSTIRSPRQCFSVPNPGLIKHCFFLLTQTSPDALFLRPTTRSHQVALLHSTTRPH